MKTGVQQKNKVSKEIVNIFEKYFGQNMEPGAIESLSLIIPPKNRYQYWLCKPINCNKIQSENAISQAFIEMDAKTKKLEHIYVQYIIDLDKAKKNRLTTEEGKKLAIDFINKHKLVETRDELQYMGEFSMGPYGSYILFKYGENQVIRVNVVAGVKRKISGFTYIDEDEAMELLAYREILLY